MRRAFHLGEREEAAALPTSWWERCPRAKDDKKALPWQWFPTLIANGVMSSSQMRCGHNHNHRLQPPKRQEQGKSARFCGLPESRFPKKERKSKVGSHCFSL